MASFRKLKLVSEEELDRLKQRQLEQYDPQLRIMARIRNQVENLLSASDETLTANERLRLLEMLQQRFRDMKSTSTPTAKIKEDVDDDERDEVAPIVEPGIGPSESVSSLATAEEPTPISSTVLSDPSILKETILSTIATRKQREARAKLQEISSYPSILSYNQKMEAVINGTPVPGSNFLRLFHSLYAKKEKSEKPVGYSEFQTAIANIELAKASSPAFSSRLRSSSLSAQTSSSKNPPPGTEPTVLHVYNR